ncbi:hypothetical protein N9805_04550 [Paracoccaceae bacterium]|nr:hypothetical protein [Paracoccaceae bacterium]
MLLTCQSASATPFDGRYYTDDNLSRYCGPDTDYQIKLKDDYLSWDEGECKLINERKINEIDGVLYYGECMDEGYLFNQQVLIVPVTTALWLSDRFDKGDIVLVEKNVDSGINQVTYLKSCPKPEE